MSGKKLTVLLPNYNNADYLKEALDSLFNQTYQDFKIIFVDDCSTDNSLEIAWSYHDPRMVIIEKNNNSGIVETLNLGLEKVDSTYFIRMDGDDISTLNRFEKLVSFMDAHDDIDICSSAMSYFGEEEGVANFESNVLQNKANLIFGHTIGHAPSIYRTETFKKNNILYLDRFWRMEDYDLFYRLKDIANATSIPDVLYLYRRGAYNTNATIEKKKKDIFRNFYKMVLTDLNVEVKPIYVNKHLQLAGREEPNYYYQDYVDYCEFLEEKNRETKKYPEKELKKVLITNLKRLAFRLVDAKRMNWKEIWAQRKNVTGLLKYAIKTRF